MTKLTLFTNHTALRWFITRMMCSTCWSTLNQPVHRVWFCIQIAICAALTDLCGSVECNTATDTHLCVFCNLAEWVPTFLASAPLKWSHVYIWPLISAYDCCIDICMQFSQIVNVSFYGLLETMVKVSLVLDIWITAHMSNFPNLSITEVKLKW